MPYWRLRLLAVSDGPWVERAALCASHCRPVCLAQPCQARPPLRTEQPDPVEVMHLEAHISAHLERREREATPGAEPW